MIVPKLERFTTSKEECSSADRMSKKTSTAPGGGAGSATVDVLSKTISVGRVGLKLSSG